MSSNLLTTIFRVLMSVEESALSTLSSETVIDIRGSLIISESLSFCTGDILYREPFILQKNNCTATKKVMCQLKLKKFHTFKMVERFKKVTKSCFYFICYYRSTFVFNGNSNKQLFIVNQV